MDKSTADGSATFDGDRTVSVGLCQNNLQGAFREREEHYTCCMEHEGVFIWATMELNDTEGADISGYFAQTQNHVLRFIVAPGFSHYWW